MPSINRILVVWSVLTEKVEIDGFSYSILYVSNIQDPDILDSALHIPEKRTNKEFYGLFAKIGQNEIGTSILLVRLIGI